MHVPIPLLYVANFALTVVGDGCHARIASLTCGTLPHASSMAEENALLDGTISENEVLRRDCMFLSRLPDRSSRDDA